MTQCRTQYENLYRLVVGDARSGAQVVEFEATGPEAALLWAGRHLVGREAEVFENDRSLGRLINVPDDGYWVISPPGANRGLAGTG